MIRYATLILLLVSSSLTAQMDTLVMVNGMKLTGSIEDVDHAFLHFTQKNYSSSTQFKLYQIKEVRSASQKKLNFLHHDIYKSYKALPLPNENDGPNGAIQGRFTKGRKQTSYGKWLIAGGTGTILVTTALDYFSDPREYYFISMATERDRMTRDHERILYGLGVAEILVGTYLWIKGGSNKRKAVAHYNRKVLGASESSRQDQASLHFTGTGLVLSF